jgi:glutathione synthase
MDPVAGILPDKDTTFALLRSAQGRGHASFHAGLADLFVSKGKVRALARPVRVHPGPPWLELGGSIDLALGDVAAVLIRKDPPFDADYLYATLLLDHARGETLIINDPRALRDANEKLYALYFPELMPATFVGANRDAILAFVASVGGHAVIKPLDGAGGIGVLAVRADDDNARGIIDVVTREGRRVAMVQEYLAAVRQGDKRILLLDGEPLGAILRVPRPDDLRSNIHVGGSVVLSELTAREKTMVSAMAPRLRADGLVFVGLDVIGERLTEVNVTSPTGIQQLGQLTGTAPEDRVIEWIERRAKA